MTTHRRIRLWLTTLSMCTAAVSQAAMLQAAEVDRLSNGIAVRFGETTLKVEVCAAGVMRVVTAKDPAFSQRPTLAAAPKHCEPTPFEVKDDPSAVVLSTRKLTARIDLTSETVTFLDALGTTILAEKKGGRALTPAIVQGELTFHPQQQWDAAGNEALYGLGQHQLGLMNIKDYDLDLWQHNGTVIVPFLVSSRGYGILWDNPSYTRFGDLRPFEPIPAAYLRDAAGHPGGLTGSYFAGVSFDRQVAQRVDGAVDIELPEGLRQANRRIHPELPADGPVSVRWEGEIVPETSGDHLFQTYSNNGIRVWIDGRLVMDHWRQGWLPWLNVAKVALEAQQRYRIKVEWTKDQGMETVRLLWKTPAPREATSLWSEVGEGVDYYFVYGPEIDQVVAGYRRITGAAPMMPRWSLGLWQCRQRYETAQQSLDVLDGFRSRRIPIDNIVQDWFYWKPDQWGSHEFDPTRFPDPDGWIRTIHEKHHARLMISVWPKFYPGTKNFDALRARRFLYEPNLGEDLRDWVGYPSTFYDAFSAEARKLFWSQIEPALFRKGIDAWWLDASEPDPTPAPTLESQRRHMHPTALGSGARVLNAFSLVNSQGVYEGQRATAPNQRVFILTRSGFAGQQRYAAATWSGDISSTWTALKAQIPAGLSFSLSGIPYWTTDSGGFSVPARWSAKDPKPEDAEEWRELNARWFQFATFCPLLRVHGEFPFREMWQFGGESHPAYRTQLEFDRLRYRLLPYLYSLAGAVTHESGTLMRALVMDFRGDARAREIGDQYMFGPAFLVSPVTTYKARSRSVYLPAGTGWYDFWTGAAQGAGRTVDVAAPYDKLPLSVRAGSIVPFGPELQYTAERPADPLTLFVYTGADAAFTLYEDDGLTYDYEKGASARIALGWNEAKHTLTIGPRTGTFPGMLAERTIQVVFITPHKPVGFSFTPRPDQTVRYRGEAVEVRLK
jgi:alpha-D-xyloside xylohydrolase